jgi:hypothetical protein
MLDRRHWHDKSILPKDPIPVSLFFSPTNIWPLNYSKQVCPFWMFKGLNIWMYKLSATSLASLSFLSSVCN